MLHTHDKPLVLVTGASGFIAGHVCVALLATSKYRVRGTVRNLSNAEHFGSHEHLKQVDLVQADLLDDAGWESAMDGVDYLLHMASPFPIGKVEPGTLVKPAVEGTERVLRAAAAQGGIRRVVLTSSVAAISSGRAPGDTAERVFTASDWTDAERADEYPKSKTLAERKAWELASELGLELTTINPSYVIGPLLSGRDCSSAVLVRRLISGDMPAVPRLWVSSVDVRDVADAHVAALDASGAAGTRYVLDSGQPRWMTEVRSLLRAAFPAQPVPRFTAPYLLVALLALWDKDAAAIRPAIGKRDASYDSAPASALLGRPLRGPQESYVDMAQSLLDLGVVRVADQGNAPKSEA